MNDKIYIKKANLFHVVELEDGNIAMNFRGKGNSHIMTRENYALYIKVTKTITFLSPVCISVITTIFGLLYGFLVCIPICLLHLYVSKIFKSKYCVEADKRIEKKASVRQKDIYEHYGFNGIIGIALFLFVISLIFIYRSYVYSKGRIFFAIVALITWCCSVIIAINYSKYCRKNKSKKI